MTTAVAPAARIDPAISGLTAVLALARFEGRMMVRHPVTWIGALGATGMAVLELREQAPVLNRVSVTLAWTLLPLAAAVALVAGWAVLRAKGRSDANPPMVMPIGMPQRVGGIFAGLAYAAVFAFILQLLLLAWVFTRDPVTSIVWSEVLAGPLYVVFAGALGAALTRWMPHPATPLFAVLILAGLMIAFPYRQEDWGLNIGLEWLSPLAWPQDIIPYEVAFRPAGLHLGYLTGLTLLLAGIAMLGRWPVAWAVLGAGLVLAGVMGPAQLGPIEDSQRAEAMSRLIGDEANFTCEIHQGVEYCAMPGYQGWIGDWRTLATPVLDAAPAEAKAGMEIRQYPVHNTFLLDGAAYNDWWWIRPAYDDFAARDVVPVGSVLNLTWGYQEVISHITNHLVGCGRTGCRGEARDIVNLWLAIHSPGVASFTVDDPSFGSEYANVTECMVRDLWGQPGVTETIRASWATLTDPETTYEEAGEILGVAVPEGVSPDGRLEGGCP